MTAAWLVGIARQSWPITGAGLAAKERKLALAAMHPALEPTDPWDDVLDVARARFEVLASLGGHHRALTLRYVDGLSVPEVAGHLRRTVHATEALLARARARVCCAYAEGRPDAG